MGFRDDVIATAKVDGKPLAEAEQAPRRDHDRMNKMERAYSLGLDVLRQAGIIERWAFEPLTFRLAHRTGYTPDFVLWYPDRRVRIIEVKGYLRDDAAVKFKLARKLFPEWEWLMVRRVKGHWERVHI